MILYLIFSSLLVLAAYLGYLHYQKRTSARTHNVSIQFKRSGSVSSDHRSQARSPIDNHAERRKESILTTPNDGTYIRNRNQARSSGVNYISPNSMYGYMPKSNILSDRNKPKELKKEFTVKLSPFPQMTRNLKSPNLTLNSPRPESINNSVNHSFLNGSITHNLTQNTDRTPTASTSMPRVSTKRPIFSNESSEDEFLLKKSKNELLDDIDIDESEMFDETRPEESVPSTKKAMKRSTLESEALLNLPQKRVKNNEILSSYSSTSVSQSHLLNKRKFQHSPDDTAANTKVKKRTYIEELKLLTSDMSPYYRNIYNPQPESTPKSAATASTNLAARDIAAQLSATKSQSESNQLMDKLIGQEQIEMIELNDDSDGDDTESQDVEIIEPEEEEEADTEQTEPIVSPISTHVFSIKDHEYDKKKSKNRLNRFLAAVQQGSESSDAELTADKEPSLTTTIDLVSTNVTKPAAALPVEQSEPTAAPLVLPKLSVNFSQPTATSSNASNITTLTSSSASTSPSMSTFTANPTLAAAPSQAPNAPVMSASNTFTFGQPSGAGSSTLVTSSAAPSGTLPSAPVPSFNTSANNMLASNGTSNEFKNGIDAFPKPAISTTNTSNSTFSFSAAAAPSFNTSMFSSNAAKPPPSTMTPNSNSRADNGLNFKPAGSGTFDLKAAGSETKPSNGGFNFSQPDATSSNASNMMTINCSCVSTMPPFTANPTFAAPSQPTNASVKLASNTFTFGQPSGAPSMTSTPQKPSFDFTSIKPLSFNAGPSSLVTSSAAPSGTLPSMPTLSFNTSANNMFASNGTSNGIDAFPKPAISTTNTSNSTFSFSAAAAPSFNTSMFSFNAAKPPQSTMTPNSNSKADNSFNFKPPGSGAFDFKASASGAVPSNGGFNFSSAASSMGNSGGFNFGKQPAAAAAPSLTAPAAPFAFGSPAPASSMPSAAPSSLPSFAFNAPAAKPNGFTFGSPNPSANSMFQFNGK